MKKVYLLFSVMLLILAACQSLPTPKSNMVVIDYAVLTNQGIFVTESNSVNFAYEPIGSISIDELGGWVRKDNKKRAANIKEDYYYNSPNLDNMFNKLAAELHELGANGIINLKITQTVEFQKEIKQFIHRVTISGMAISK